MALNRGHAPQQSHGRRVVTAAAQRQPEAAPHAEDVGPWPAAGPARSRWQWIAAGTVGTVAFAGVVVAVATRRLADAVDLLISRWAAAHRFGALTQASRLLSTITAPEALLPLALLGALALWRWRGGWEPIALTTIGGAGAVSSYVVAKTLAARPRPSGGLVHAGGYGFPSGHATVTTLLVLLGLWWWTQGRSPSSRTAAWVLGAVVMAAVGWDRIYLGVHFPTDVVGGIALGLAWASWAIVVVRLSARRVESLLAGLGARARGTRGGGSVRGTGAERAGTTRT